MNAAPIPEDENKRLDALSEYSILDSEAESVFDEIVALASFICGTPISTITLIDEKRQWFKAQVGLKDSQTPRDVAFCAHAILQNELMVVNDAREDKRFNENPLVLGKPDIRFYAGMPLITADGYKLGTICVIDTKPKVLSKEQSFALRVLSNQVMKLLELRKQNIALAKMHSMHNKLLSIIGHDLRGPVKSIDGLLHLAENYGMTFEEYKELIPRLRQLVDTTDNLLFNILNWAKNQIEGKATVKEPLSVRVLLQQIVEAHSPLFKTKQNQIVNEVNDDVKILIDKNRLEFVSRNLLLNANKYMNNGTIRISTQTVGDKLEICVADSGPGIDEDRHSALFEWGGRNSTNGTNGERGSGLGLPMCKEFVEDMGGTIWLTSEIDKGTSFFFTLKVL